MGKRSRVKPLSVVGAALTITTLILLAVSVAFAEDAVPAPTATEAPAAAPAVPTKFYLEVDQADLNAISVALNELPKKIADPLMLKLSAQLQAQQQTKITEAKDAAEKARKGKK